MAYAEDVELLNVVGTWDYLAGADCTEEQLVALIARLKQARSNLADAEDHLTRQLFRERGTGTHVIAGAAVEVRMGKERTEWKHDELRRAAILELAKRHGGNVTTVEAIVTDWTAVSGPSGWKLTGIRALGLQVDEFTTARPGRPSVTIHGSP